MFFWFFLLLVVGGLGGNGKCVARISLGRRVCCGVMASETQGADADVLSLVELEQCSYWELREIAKQYNVPLPQGAKKKEAIFAAVARQLLSRGVIEPATESEKESLELNMTEVKDSAADTVGLEQDAEPAGAQSADHPLVEVDSDAGGRPQDMGEVLRLRALELEIEQTKLRNEQCKLERQKNELDMARLRGQAYPEAAPGQPAYGPQHPASAPQHQQPGGVTAHGSSSGVAAFDISKQIALVPAFKEGELDNYFCAFERIARAVNWPREFWSLLLHCKLTGRAQDICSALSVEESLDYDVVKAAILSGFELVPEHYRQKFRSAYKSPTQSFVEFGREKATLFKKWCNASNVHTFEQLSELILLEDFKACIPERIVIYLEEQKVNSIAKASVRADEFDLTHRSSVSPVRGGQGLFDKQKKQHRLPQQKSPQRGATAAPDSRACFYCHETGHIVSRCPKVQQKQQKERENGNGNSKKPKGVGFVRSVPLSAHETAKNVRGEAEECFGPFILEGSVSLSDMENERVPIKILRDTGASQSLILQSVLPFSENTFCGSDALVLGVEMKSSRAPLHLIHLRSPLISGLVQVGLRETLPIGGVAMILGNDIAGDKVFASLEVVEQPRAEVAMPVRGESPTVFPACAVTRAQSRKFDDEVTLNDTFLCAERPVGGPPRRQRKKAKKGLLPTNDGFGFDVDKNTFAHAQKHDPSLSMCWEAANQVNEAAAPSAFRVEDGVLVRKWFPPAVGDLGWNVVRQIVVPLSFRSQILSLAHDNISGHLGVRKTYDRILRYFYWPGLKSSVVDFCRTCHVCQMTGKPNQIIPPAPLKPIPAVSEPFERILIDCVGPLPKTKSGYQYLLTVMCTATRYPEAFPLRSLKAKPVIKALTNFFFDLRNLPLYPK